MKDDKPLSGSTASGTPSAQPAADLATGSEGSGEDAITPSPGSSTALRQLATLATNVAILTALLVYFGWRRTETQAAQLGIDESILGLSTRDYLLRSVGPVLQLLAIVSVAGLVAVYLDRSVRRRAETHGSSDRFLRLSLLGMSISWLLLPLFVIGLGYVVRPFAYVAFPLAIGAGILLLSYADHLRRELHGRKPWPSGWQRLERASLVVALCVAVFWATSNYAEVLGNQIADQVINHVSDLTSVTVYTTKRLGISAPGTRETLAHGMGQSYRYRYSGLRLLEHTGDRYFLISDLWKPESGAVIMLIESSSMRLEFGATAAK